MKRARKIPPHGNATTVEQAAERYGKPFAHQIKIERIKPRSAFLEHLDRMSETRSELAIRRVKLVGGK